LTNKTTETTLRQTHETFSIVGFTETHQRQTDITESLIKNKLEIIQHRTENRIINSACCQHRL